MLKYSKYIYIVLIFCASNIVASELQRATLFLCERNQCSGDTFNCHIRNHLNHMVAVHIHQECCGVALNHFKITIASGDGQIAELPHEPGMEYDITGFPMIDRKTMVPGVIFVGFSNTVRKMKKNYVFTVTGLENRKDITGKLLRSQLSIIAKGLTKPLFLVQGFNGLEQEN